MIKALTFTVAHEGKRPLGTEPAEVTVQLMFAGREIGTWQVYGDETYGYWGVMADEWATRYVIDKMVPALRELLGFERVTGPVTPS